jgi:hypothetical protein
VSIHRVTKRSTPILYIVEYRFMSDNHRRLRADLDAILDATGITSNPTRGDVQAWLSVLVGAALALAWVIVPHGLPPTWGGMALAGVPLAFHAYRTRSATAVGDRKVSMRSLVAALLATGAALGYRVWTRDLGLSRTTAGAVLLFGAGLGILASSVDHQRKVERIGFALLLMGGGIVLASNTLAPLVAVYALFGIAGAVGAAYAQWRVRSLA